MTVAPRPSLAALLCLAIIAGSVAHAEPPAKNLPDAMDVPDDLARKPGDAPDLRDAAPDAGTLPEQAPLPATAPVAARPPTIPSASPSASPGPVPDEEVACRARLVALGVVFEDAPPISEASGCVAPHPLVVTRLSQAVALEPPATLTCAMAEASASFVRDHAAPAARREFGAGIATIGQVSAYVCRPRNGTTKLSEHAFANALDWGSLVLDDGETIEVRAHGRTEPRRTRLIETLRQRACGPFSTVLGPGSDADHSDHFHFDLALRRGGSTFCQ